MELKPPPTRDELAALYLEQLPYEPYPVQEEALLAWFTAAQGVLVCAPTGTGKTLIAEAAMFEALHLGRKAYYTTPLIALTDQKFQEMRTAAEKWGFSPDDVGLVTGNRRINAEATVLVVVAEILFNRLLHREAFDFSEVSAVVMDEFHSFNDRERGIVWEFSLGLLPKQVRTLLLSATVGNSRDFCWWLEKRHDRRLELVESSDRKVPLTYQWASDALLGEHLEAMHAGDEAARTTPALIFCFNREECWSVAEHLKGKKLVGDERKKRLADELNALDMGDGAGPKLKQVLMRGIGVHHAGVLPRYRRIVEDLFQKKLLSVCVCTETLAAGINLPARSVVIPKLVKGPPDKKKLIEPSAAHQMFGRAGRPQFDDRGFVYGLAHEDDVKIERWRRQYDQIPDDTKDPGLRKAKKNLKKKMPTRRTGETYWTEKQFEQLRDSPPGKLASRGDIPWRLLAYMLDASPEIEPLRELVGKRLLSERELETSQKSLERMLRTLWKAGYVELEPPPPKDAAAAEETAEPPKEAAKGLLRDLATKKTPPAKAGREADSAKEDIPPAAPVYRPEFAHPTGDFNRLLVFRGVNPLYGVFLVNQLGIADRAERLMAMESVLEMPGSVARFVRPPKQDELPPGPLAKGRLDHQLLTLGLATAEELGAAQEEQEEDRGRPTFYEQADRVFVLSLGEKLKRLFDFDFPGVHDVRVTSVWAAGELLSYGGDFNSYITANGLQKQEGIIFRHCLRLILLVGEFARLHPPDVEAAEWQADLDDIVERLTEVCRQVDPDSTDKTLQQLEADEADVITP